MHKCSYTDRIEIQNKKITRIIKASYNDKSVEVFKENEKSQYLSRYLYYYNICGYLVEFPGEIEKYKYGSGSYVQITQTENTELYDNIISALKNLGIHYRVDCDKRKPNVKWIKFGRQIHVSLFESLFGIGSKN